MKANKDKTIEITSKVLNLSPAVISRAYDEQIGIFSTDGTFDPKAVGGAQAIIHRDGPAEGNSRRQGHVHHAVRAGKDWHVAAGHQQIGSSYEERLFTVSGLVPIQ